MFPSASLARGYESFGVLTKSGRVHTGLISRETAAALFLRTTDRVEVRIERNDIDELSPSRTSIMPQGLEKLLSPADLRDLVAFLASREMTTDSADWCTGKRTSWATPRGCRARDALMIRLVDQVPR